jgi:hypothetical protein
MTLTLPHTIVGGERENVAHLMNNDLAIRDAINEAAGTAENFYDTVTLVDNSSGLSTDSMVNHAGKASLSSTIISAPWPAQMYIDPADHDVADFTTRWRMFVTIGIGSVNPAITAFTVSFRPIPVMAGDALDIFTVGITDPIESVVIPLNTVGLENTTATSDLFSIDTAGTYGFTVSALNSKTADSVFTVHAGLRVEYV